MPNMLLKLVAPEGAIFFIINAWGSPRSKTGSSTEGSRITRRRWIAGKQFEASELSTCRDGIVVFVPHFYIFVLFAVGHFVRPAVVGFLTLKTSTLSCNEEKEEITKPPTR